MQHEQLHVIFHGRVQGVGFRWTITDYAERYQLKGTAQNLRDGSVEVYAEGAKESLESFLNEVQNDPGIARIESVNAEYKRATHGYQDFRIIY